MATAPTAPAPLCEHLELGTDRERNAGTYLVFSPDKSQHKLEAFVREREGHRTQEQPQQLEAWDEAHQAEWAEHIATLETSSLERRKLCLKCKNAREDELWELVADALRERSWHLKERKQPELAAVYDSLFVRFTSSEEWRAVRDYIRANPHKK